MIKAPCLPPDDIEQEENSREDTEEQDECRPDAAEQRNPGQHGQRRVPLPHDAPHGRGRGGRGTPEQRDVAQWPPPLGVDDHSRR
jgi:hypothetical protein